MALQGCGWQAAREAPSVFIWAFCSDYVNDARMGERRSIEDMKNLCTVQRLLILKENHYLEQLMGKIVHTCI